MLAKKTKKLIEYKVYYGVDDFDYIPWREAKKMLASKQEIVDEINGISYNGE